MATERQSKKKYERKPPDITGLYGTGLLTPSAVLRLVPFSRIQIWRLIKAGKFPKPVQLGVRAIAFRAPEIKLWIDSLPPVKTFDEKQEGTPE